jgi:hypothetical protein
MILGCQMKNFWNLPLEKMMLNSPLHQLAKYIAKFSFRSISTSCKCLNAWYALSLPFMRKSADASSATSGTAVPCFKRELTEFLKKLVFTLL